MSKNCNNITVRLGTLEDLPVLLSLDRKIFQQNTQEDYYIINIIDETCYVA